jgi:hypothetical protein
MHEVPVARVSVRAGVLAHGRNKYSIRERNVANRKRIKQASHRVWAAFLNLKQVRCLISRLRYIDPAPISITLRGPGCQPTPQWMIDKEASYSRYAEPANSNQGAGVSVRCTSVESGSGSEPVFLQVQPLKCQRLNASVGRMQEMLQGGAFLVVILSPLSSYHGIRMARGVEVALERRACVGSPTPR